MQSIPSAAVCDFYYFFFVLNSILAVLAILGLIGILAFFKLPKNAMIATGFNSILIISLGVLQALFQYIICDRAIVGAGAQPETGDPTRA